MCELGDLRAGSPLERQLVGRPLKLPQAKDSCLRALLIPGLGGADVGPAGRGLQQR